MDRPGVEPGRLGCKVLSRLTCAAREASESVSEAFAFAGTTLDDPDVFCQDKLRKFIESLRSAVLTK
jgi:hypothetical protein